MSDGESQEMTRPCPSCGHENPFSQRFCTECGATMRSSERIAPSSAPGSRTRSATGGAASGPRRKRSKSRSRDGARSPSAPSGAARDTDRDAPGGPRPGSRAERAQVSLARQEFGKLKSTLRTLRTLAVVGAVSSGVLLLVVLTVLFGGRLDSDTQGIVVIFAVITGAVLALQVVGAWKLYRAPLLWSVVLASVYSLDALLRFFGGSGVFDKVVVAVVTVLYWCGVVLAGRAQRLMQEYPEFQVNRERISAERKVDGGVADSARSRRSQRRSTGRQTALVVAGLAVLVTGMGGTAIWAAIQPPSLQSEVGRFCDLATEGKWGAAGELVQSRGFDDQLSRRGWDTSRPKVALLGMGDAKGPERNAEISIAGGKATTYWREVPGVGPDGQTRWRMVRWDLPEFRWPEMDPFLATFRKAWGEGSDSSLLAHLNTAYAARMGAKLKASLARPAWSEDRPEMLAPEVTASTRREATCRVVFPLADGRSVKTTWTCRSPRWEVTKMVLSSRR